MKYIKLKPDEYDALMKRIEEANDILRKGQRILDACQEEHDRIIKKAEDDAYRIRNSINERTAVIQLKQIREDFSDILDCHFSSNGVYQGKNWFGDGFGSGTGANLFLEK